MAISKSLLLIYHSETPSESPFAEPMLAGPSTACDRSHSLEMRAQWRQQFWQ